MGRLIFDIRIALRGLRRSPTFAVSATLILAIGIGMAVAMVTVFDAVLVRKLPVRDEQRLVVAWSYFDPAVEAAFSRQTLERSRPESRTMTGIAGVAHWGATPSPITDGDRSLVLNRGLVSGNFFDVVGARPVLGRLFRSDDDVTGAPPVMVLTYATWQQKFAGDSSVIGRHVSEPYGLTNFEIVGVAPPGLDYPVGADYWVPIWQGNGSMIVVARLAPGATPAGAQAELFALAQRLEPQAHYVGVKLQSFTQAVVGNVRPVLIVLTAAVALLLVVACVNVGNLLLLRAASRKRELAIRRALGASFGDITRQLFAESALLAIGGGTLGFFFAQALLKVLIAFSPTRFPRADVVHIAGAPLASALGVSVVAVLIFGIAPSLATARASSSNALGQRSGTSTRRRRLGRNWLVASQAALALITLASAGLLVRTLQRLEHIDLGYTAEHLAVFPISMPAAKYSTGPKLTTLGSDLLARWRRLPGVTALTPVLIPPFIGPNVWQGPLEVEGAPPLDRAARPFVPLEVGDEDYFRTLGIKIVRGRGFVETDREGAPLVAVVSEAIAQRYWPNENPVGKRIRFWGPDTITSRTIVGVASDIRFRSLRDATPTVYLSWRQSSWQGWFAVRTSGSLAAVLPALERTAREVDPQISLWQPQTLEQFLAAPLSQPRLSAFLLSGFSVVALLLAAIGLYGVMSFAVREETREMGVRMALGATPNQLRRIVLGRAFRVIGAGALAGLVVVLMSSRLLTAVLFEVSPTDPITLALAIILLVGVGLAAAYVPARRATLIDPARALRAD